MLWSIANGVRYFPEGIFPKATPKYVTVSPVVTFQLCNFQSGNFPKVRLGPLRRRRMQWGAERCGWDRLGKLSLRKFLIWEVATLENNLGKLPLEKNPLRKYLTSCKLSIRRRFNNLYDTYTSSTLSPCSFTNFDFKHIRSAANLSV